MNAQADARIRLFIAVRTPPEVKDWLDRLVKALDPELTAKVLRFISPENLHITLHFLGDTSVDRLLPIERALKKVAADAAPFDLRPGALGFFPGSRSPRVFWIGLAAGSEHTERVYLRLGEELSASGFRLDTRPYHPHITLGYVRKDAPRAAARRCAEELSAVTPDNPPSWRAEGVSLVESTLTPGGALHSERVYVPFGNGARG